MSRSKIEHTFKGCERVEKQPPPKKLQFAILTISTSRYRDRQTNPGDTSGDVIERLIKHARHVVSVRNIVPDDKNKIKNAVMDAVSRADVDCVITTGGTGLTETDVTIETVKPILKKELQGFGEIFRAISYDQIGRAAILSSATAGIRDGKAIFCLPGSPNAVETAMKKLVLEIAPSVIALSRQK